MAQAQALCCAFDEFRAAPRKARNWNKELEQDARDNEKTFGRR